MKEWKQELITNIRIVFIFLIILSSIVALIMWANVGESSRGKKVCESIYYQDKRFGRDRRLGGDAASAALRAGSSAIYTKTECYFIPPL